MDLELAGKAAIVTGGSRGLGRAIALALAAEGARVAICARGEEGVRAAERELRGAGPGPHLALARASWVTGACVPVDGCQGRSF